MRPIEAAYRRTCRIFEESARTRDWGMIADTLVAEGVYRRPGMPDLVGREAVREHFSALCDVLPGSLLDRIELVWHSFDEPHGLAVCQVRHGLRDPGDGSTHFALTTSTLTYGRDGCWAQVADHFNPESYRTMYRGWVRAAHRCGRSGLDPVVLDSLEGAFELAARPVDGQSLRRPTLLG